MIYITNKVGEIGISGAGIFRPGERRAVSMEVAARVDGNPDFEVSASGDLPFRDKNGDARYLGFSGSTDPRFGYGTGGVAIVRALMGLDIAVRFNPHYRGSFATNAPADVRTIFGKKAFIPGLEIAQCLPSSLAPSLSRRVMWTMWETSEPPNAKSTYGLGNYTFPGPPRHFGDWPGLINSNSERLVVPCAHNKELFENYGVRVPVDVIPYGIRDSEWPFQSRKRGDVFTFFQYGDLSARKGAYEAIVAFKRAFPKDKNVRLVLKTYQKFDYSMSVPEIDDPRIVIVNELWTHDQLLKALYRSDAFVWLSRGEGFGFPPLQALLTGLPVISTRHTGMAEWI